MTSEDLSLVVGMSRSSSSLVGLFWFGWSTSNDRYHELARKYSGQPRKLVLSSYNEYSIANGILTNFLQLRNYCQ